MSKTVQEQSSSEENRAQLQEIAETQIGTLSDDEILRILALRKRLSDSEHEREKSRKEEAARLESEKKEKYGKLVEKKKTEIFKKIEELNKSISPEKEDDDLLGLVAKRRELENVLEKLDSESSASRENNLPGSVSPVPAAADELSEQEESSGSVPEEEVSGNVQDGTEEVRTEISPAVPQASVDEDFGSEKISDDVVGEGSEFHRYLDQLKNNVGSLGELLLGMPLDAKRNKAFMLKVAEIDPAYAMHYADTGTLKKDEDFNLRVASLPNPRNSGNALAEMLPEARTSKVLMAAVRQDYRNVRFIQPSMADYDEMISIAKKGALEKVRSLKEATDVMRLIPKPLQQDKPFMLQVKEITEPKQVA